MNKKWIYAVIIILLIVVGSYGVLVYNSSVNAKVGDSSSVTIPEGFKFNNIKDGITLISNKNTKLFVQEVKNPQPMDLIIQNFTQTNKDKYKLEQSSKDFADGVHMESVIAKNNESKLVSANYWYTKNGKTYRIDLRGKGNGKAVETLVNTTTLNPLPFI